MAQVLSTARHNVAQHALGEAIACHETARAHALGREQFGKPIAAFQVVQAKFVRMRGTGPRPVRGTAANPYSRPAYLVSRSARLAARSMGSRLDIRAISSANAAASDTACSRGSARPAASAAA